MLKYCLLVNLATTTLLLSLASFFTTVEHNVLQSQQPEIDPALEEEIIEDNSAEAEITDDYAVTITNKQFIGSEDILILNLTGQPIPIQDGKLIVSGIVRPFTKEKFEQDYNLTWDLEIQKQLETKYTHKPVLVVNYIYPATQQ